METLTEIDVRYSETDGMGVVYHANYLVYCEVGRSDYLNQLGFPYKQFEDSGYLSPVLTCNLTYSEPFHYGDTIVVRTRVTKVTSVRTQYQCDMYLKGEDVHSAKPHFTAVTTHCLVSKEDFRPVVQKRMFPALQKAYEEAVEAV